MHDSLILISSNPDDAVFAQAASEVNGLTLSLARTHEEASQLLQKHKRPIVFIDADREDLFEDYENLLSSHDTNSIHFLRSSRLEFSRLVLRSPIFGSYIQRNFGDAKAAGSHYGRVLKTCDKSHEEARGQKLAEFELKKSGEKRPTVLKVQEALSTVMKSNRIASIVANAADEILMNAIFDAPSDLEGHQRFESTSRALDMPVEPHVQFEVRDDGDYVALKTVDHCGSLDKKRLLSRLSTIYRDDQSYVDPSVSGAGIGLAAVYRSGGSFLFSSEPKRRTEVTVYFKKLPTVRELKTQFRFISLQFQ
jgi:hypothetical protein